MTFKSFAITKTMTFRLFMMMTVSTMMTTLKLLMTTMGTTTKRMMNGKIWLLRHAAAEQRNAQQENAPVRTRGAFEAVRRTAVAMWHTSMRFRSSYFRFSAYLR